MNDDELHELTTSGVPPRGSDYWADIRASLVAVDEERDVDGSASKNWETNSAPQRLSTMSIVSDEQGQSFNRNWLFAGAAASLLVLLIGGVYFATGRQSSSTTEAATSKSTISLDADSGAGTDTEVVEGSEDLPEADEPATAESSTTVSITTTSAAESTSSSANETTSTPPSTLTTTSTTTSTSMPSTSKPGLGGDAEPGLQYDYGDIDSVEFVDDRPWIMFDRWSFGLDNLQGVQLDFEPRWELATDWHGGDNVNPKLRRYPLSANHTVLQIDPAVVEASCSGELGPITFVESDVETLAAAGGLVSLTFNDQGEVVRVRDQTGC